MCLRIVCKFYFFLLSILGKRNRPESQQQSANNLVDIEDNDAQMSSQNLKKLDFRIPTFLETLTKTHTDICQKVDQTTNTKGWDRLRILCCGRVFSTFSSLLAGLCVEVSKTTFKQKRECQDERDLVLFAIVESDVSDFGLPAFFAGDARKFSPSVIR